MSCHVTSRQPDPGDFRLRTYKSGRHSDHVEFVLGPVLEPDALLGDVGDAVVLDVDDVHVGPVELLVVVLLQARPLDAEEVRHLLGRQDLALARVPDADADVVPPEVVGLLVRLGIEEHVLVVAEPESEAAVVPERAVEGLALLGRVIEGPALVHSVEEAAEALLPQLEQPWVPLLGAVLLLGRQHALAHRDGQVGRALEDLELAGPRSPLLRDLHPRRTSADHGTPLVLDVHTLLGPERRVVDHALELLQPGPLGDVPLRGLWDLVSTRRAASPRVGDLRIRLRRQKTCFWRFARRPSSHATCPRRCGTGRRRRPC